LRIARFRSSLDADDGGIFTAVIASSAALADEHDIAIAARRIAGDPAGLHTRSRARIVALPTSLGGRIRATHRLVAGADLVTLEGPWDPWNPLTAAACVARRTPYLCVAHGSWSHFVKDRYPAKHLKKLLWWGLVEHWVVRGGAGIWWTTEREKRSSIGTFPGIPDRDPVVELATEDLRGDRGTAPRDPGVLRLVTLTRIHPLKRLDDLVRAVAGLAAAPYGLRVHLSIVGDGPPEVIAGLTALAADLGVADRITWTGPLWGDARIAPLAAADVYVCPGPESFGMAVAEALSANLPVVVSDEVALAGEIEEAGAGAVFRYADVPDLTAALARVAAAVADPGYETAPRQLWERRFSPEAFRRRVRESGLLAAGVR
jgi:glycosyltransferase involved in cell wall biosynthesis